MNYPVRDSHLPVDPLLTDMYQITMAYAYWKTNRHNDTAVFDLFFRRCPFGGEFAIFAGLGEVLRFVENFHFDSERLDYIKSLIPNCDPKFIEWLGQLDCSDMIIHAQQEGSVVFPRVPLMRIIGSLAIVQLLETSLLNLVNYATLVATNAARFRLAAGDSAGLLEFGLRRAQGPNGALSASLYSYIGGFDATSNVLAGKLFGIPVKGTHAHAFVQSFIGLADLSNAEIVTQNGEQVGFFDLVLGKLKEVKEILNISETNQGELTAFIAYAQAFPHGFLALVDTYDTLASGVPNFLAVASALRDCGYAPLGIRLDSGDLVYLSQEARRMIVKILGEETKISIVASNDINEATLLSLREQGHEIDVFGIGTHLVTCQAQPALGGVYKLVEINGKPRIKLSNQPEKITLPGRKQVFRIYGQDGKAILDLLAAEGERVPQAGQKIMCYHPSDHRKRAFVTPGMAVPLLTPVYSGYALRNLATNSVELARNHVKDELEKMRPDHLRLINPTPYKVSLTERLLGYLDVVWSQESIVPEIF
jgi:nicotinate phosphoribosyltransferase